MCKSDKIESVIANKEVQNINEDYQFFLKETYGDVNTSIRLLELVLGIRKKVNPYTEL